MLKIIGFNPNKRLCDYSFRKDGHKEIYCKKLGGDICPQVHFCTQKDRWIFNDNVLRCPVRERSK